MPTSRRKWNGFKQDSWNPNPNPDSDSLIQCNFFSESRFGFTTYPNPDSLIEYPQVSTQFNLLPTRAFTNGRSHPDCTAVPRVLDRHKQAHVCTSSQKKIWHTMVQVAFTGRMLRFTNSIQHRQIMRSGICACLLDSSKQINIGLQLHRRKLTPLKSDVPEQQNLDVLSTFSGRKYGHLVIIWNPDSPLLTG